MGDLECTSTPASGPVISWRRALLVAGSNLAKYSATAASDSARLISFTCLLHERGMARAWVARPRAGRRVERRMVTTMVGGHATASTLPSY